ncbi:hypothetical protein SAMN04515671_1487 [Nakamurella panacisegetis]|uniref:Cytochrome b subunit of formate dehydrogenase n=1 Tax=Nakamurella panacisegetis TaxID=1090615 RepID=A0A1H0KZH2_9ACTN|nr:hypothetical protein [Nakamurella panacisegetis]SDO61245.1 hypothetical protein SAMN04515671_1487 [Nakamurella panacisegetis]
MLGITRRSLELLVNMLDPKMLAWIDTPSTVDRAEATPEGQVSGVNGNTRLTAATGMVLLVLLAVEGITILSVRQMITLHIYVGILLLGPVLLKTGSTLYRFTRYYTGTPAYVQKGPPHPLLRILGPFVILSTLALLGTGIALIFLGPQRSDLMLTLHQTAFWIWVVLMTVHVLGHLVGAATTAWTELRNRLRGPGAAGRRWRFGLLVLALVLGVGAATILLPHATTWTNRTFERHAPERVGG